MNNIEGKASNKDEIWLDIARSSYLQSTNYIDNNFRKDWDDGIRHFQSKHDSSSKYLKSSYTHRSRLFRPKTRSIIRSTEAAASAAFFSNQDVVNIAPTNDNIKIQKASADVNNELLNYRLEKTIPWYITLIGGLQDSLSVGVVCSRQHWVYEEKEVKYQYYDIDEQGNEIKKDGVETAVVKDQPKIDLIPIENLRIHPASNWADPIGTSPYVILLIPMHVADVKKRMERDESKTGKRKWRKYTDGEIKAATKLNYDITRLTREEQREDRYASSTSNKLGDYDIVWVHENFIRMDGEIMHYYTLGVEHMLTDPSFIEEVYFHGEIPIVVGFTILETHLPYKPSIGKLSKNIQKELNTNVNQRLDNVKFVMNKRWGVSRGRQVDVKALSRNVAGGVIMATDPKSDIVPYDFADVTGSAYAEQERLNSDFDELVGAFSSSSIQTSRRLNETVGGMNMLRGSANALTEYMLRTFAETWVEPVLRQLLKLEQKYETDQVILTLAAEKANLYQKYGIDKITDELLDQELTCRINVGMGATDPIMRVERFIFAIKSLMDIMKSDVLGLNLGEIAEEIFGRLGYKDGSRFILKGDEEDIQNVPLIQNMQAIIKDLQAKLQSKDVEQKTKIVTAQMKEEGEDRRTSAELKTEIMKEVIKLMNPTSGEKNE
ncbi:MAG: hypothetical protein SVO01_00515 [Thermotogota bacterium]|nr:hypothetical protein [Thermotogota bacterium]